MKISLRIILIACVEMVSARIQYFPILPSHQGHILYYLCRNGLSTQHNDKGTTYQSHVTSYCCINLMYYSSYFRQKQYNYIEHCGRARCRGLGGGPGGPGEDTDPPD